VFCKRCLCKYLIYLSEAMATRKRDRGYLHPTHTHTHTHRHTHTHTHSHTHTHLFTTRAVSQCWAYVVKGSLRPTGVQMSVLEELNQPGPVTPTLRALDLTTDVTS